MAPLTIFTSTVTSDFDASVAPSYGPVIVAAAAAAAATAASDSEPSSPTTPTSFSTASDAAVPGDEGGITLKTVLVLIFMFFLFATIVVAFFLVARSSHNRNGQPRVPSSPRSQTSSLRRILPSAAGIRWGATSRSPSDMGLGVIGRAGRSPAMRSAPSASRPYIQGMHRSSIGSLRTLQGYDNELGLTLSHFPDNEINAFDDAQGSVHSGSAHFLSNFDASAVTLVNSGHLQPPAYPENTAIPIHVRARPVLSTAAAQ